MLVTGIKSPVPLDELEEHLRDEAQARIRSGWSEQRAFEFAIGQIGNGNLLQAEFNKNVMLKRNKMKQRLSILAALFGTVFGGALVLPALGRWHHQGILVLWPMVLGCALILLGGCVAINGVRRYRGAQGRKWIASGILAAGAFYMVPLVQSCFFQSVDTASWVFCIFLALASILFYGTCFHLNGACPQDLKIDG